MILRATPARVVDDLVHGRARLLVRDIDDVAATSAVNEVIEADPVDVLGFDEVEDAIEVRDVVGREGEAQSDLLANGLAMAEGGDRLLERVSRKP